MKHEIEIPDLPEGWEAVAYRVPIKMVDYILLTSGVIAMCSWDRDGKYLIVRKKQPHRIVLEETGEIRQSCYLLKINDGNLILPPGREYKIVEDKNETRD